MAVVQGIQTKQFALESRTTEVDADAAHRARLTLASLALRHGATDTRAALVDALEMLGLAQPAAERAELLAVSS